MNTWNCIGVFIVTKSKKKESIRMNYIWALWTHNNFETIAKQKNNRWLRNEEVHFRTIFPTFPHACHRITKTHTPSVIVLKTNNKYIRYFYFIVRKSRQFWSFVQGHRGRKIESINKQVQLNWRSIWSTMDIVKFRDFIFKTTMNI